MFQTTESCYRDDYIRNNKLLSDCLKYKGCLKCPDYGFCDMEGRLVSCDKNFKKKGSHCVKDA